EHGGGHDEGGTDGVRVVLQALECALQREGDQDRDGPDHEQQQHAACFGVGPEPEEPEEVLAEVDDDREQRSQVENGGNEERGLWNLHAEGGEEGGDQHEMARRRDREELGQALDEPPDDGGEHGTARYSEPTPTPTTSRPSAAAAAASATAAAGTAIVPWESPKASVAPRATTRAGISLGRPPSPNTMATATVPGGAWSGTGASMRSQPSGMSTSVTSEGTSGSPADRSVAATISSSPATGKVPAGTSRYVRCCSWMRVPAGTSTARNGTAAVGGGANSDHAATVTRIAPASHLERGGRSNQSTSRTYGTGSREERGSVGGRARLRVALGFALRSRLRARLATAGRARTRVGDVVAGAFEDDATGVEDPPDGATALGMDTQRLVGELLEDFQA